MTTIPRAPAREIFGWAMFDFANSSYTTVIVTVVFNVTFTSLVVEMLRSTGSATFSGAWRSRRATASSC